MGNVTRPRPHSLDWVASVEIHGWNPGSGEDAPYSYGDLSIDFMAFEETFRVLMEIIKRSDESYLLSPMSNIAEPSVYPLVNNPVDEPMVAVDPSKVLQTGLVPIAALWQSGWESAHPYVLVRAGVYGRLLRVAQKLRDFNPFFTLCITDGWRSLGQQKELYDAFYPEGIPDGEDPYVSKPEYEDEKAAPHPSGGAVDVMLGMGRMPVHIGSELDHMDIESHTDHFEDNPGLRRDVRRFFTNLLTQAGFASLASEWWHVEYGTRRWAAKTGKDPLYGNAQVTLESFESVLPVAPLQGSRRAEQISQVAVQLHRARNSRGRDI